MCDLRSRVARAQDTGGWTFGPVRYGKGRARAGDTTFEIGLSVGSGKGRARASNKERERGGHRSAAEVGEDLFVDRVRGHSP